MGILEFIASFLVLAGVTALGIFLCICVGWSAREWSVYYGLNRGGQIADAEITKLQWYRCIGRNGLHFVDYRFDTRTTPPGAILHKGHQEISPNAFHSLTQGALVKVSYLPQRPSISRLAGKNTDYTFRNWTTLAAWAAFVVIIIWQGVLAVPLLFLFWFALFMLHTLWLKAVAKLSF